MQGSDVIIHTAAVVDFNGYTPKALIWKVNVNGTMTLLKAAAFRSVSAFIYSSSVCALCPNENLDEFAGDEDTPYSGDPIMPYGKSKREAERLVMSQNGDVLPDGKIFRSAALRLHHVYGENSPVLKMTIDTCKSAKTLAEITSSKIDYVYLGNAAWAHVIAACRLQEAHSEELGGNVYFVSDDTPHGSYSQTYLAFLEHRGFKKHPRVPYIPYWLWMTILHICVCLTWLLSLAGIKRNLLITPKMQRMTEGEYKSDGSKFRKLFSYKPRYTWEDAKKRTQLWVDSYLNESLH